MQLSKLLQRVDVLESTASPDTEITGISYDSRITKPGELFVAITGYATDGHKFIPMAVQKGAGVILCEKKPKTTSLTCSLLPPGRPLRSSPPTGLTIRQRR